MIVERSPLEKVRPTVTRALGTERSRTRQSSISVHEPWDLELETCVLTVGAFDGVHRGHQVLIRRATARAVQLGIPSVAYTFDPPPKVFFRGAPQLTPLSEKIGRLEATGLDHVVVIPFDAAYAARGEESFLQELEPLNPIEVWVGHDFRFGKGQAGDPVTLRQSYPTRTLDTVRCQAGVAVSSSRVRDLLAEGDLGQARALLGWSA